MDLPRPLHTGRLVRRYKRFLADVRLDDGRELTVHCPNSGAMTGMKEPGLPVLVSDSGNPRRKLLHTLERVQADGAWVCVNTALPNHVVAEAVAAGRVPELAGYDELRREVRHGERSRIDLLLDDAADGGPRCWVEVKSVTLARDSIALFPDAVTARGRRHLEELAACVGEGDRACLLFVVGREDCDRVRPADDVDPAYGATLRRVVEQGVEVLAYRVRHEPGATNLADRVPVELAV